MEHLKQIARMQKWLLTVETFTCVQTVCGFPDCSDSLTKIKRKQQTANGKS